MFYNSTLKIETGTANRLGSTNSEPPGPIIMMCQSETLNSSHIKFITPLSAEPFTSHHKLFLRENHFPEPNRHNS